MLSRKNPSSPTPELGKKYRSVITGFTGTSTAKIEHLYGCTRWELTGTIGGEPKSFMFDEPELEAVATPTPIKPQRDTGGPHGLQAGPR